jgi:hypothetical protein
MRYLALEGQTVKHPQPIEIIRHAFVEDHPKCHCKTLSWLSFHMAADVSLARWIYFDYISSNTVREGKP